VTQPPAAFRAFVAEKLDDRVERGIRTFGPADLPPGHVTVRVDWSSVNYKDALATIPDGRVARMNPLVPGIDLAGEVINSEDPAIPAGSAILAHGYDLGVAHHGGYAERARVPADWIVPLPSGLPAREAMAIGTAGYTAARCVMALEAHGLSPDDGPVLVTGASGGVGSVAVDILAGRGYEVVASTGSDAADWLESLGASSVISRSDVIGDEKRPLAKSVWAGAVDCAGGDVLAGVIRGLRYGGSVAACGNTAGVSLPTSVLPFILRGVSLLGIDSVQTPIADRRETWARLADDLKPPHLADTIAREVSLDQVEDALDAILRGELQGRTIVRVA
jgi:acrylyl-CoA reductase (NADPH)